MEEEEIQQLLSQLKATVETAISDQATGQISNVPFFKLCTVVENIFKHGYIVFNQDGKPDLWMFMQGLNWLQPSLRISEGNIQSSSKTKDIAMSWLFKCLEDKTLSEKLSWLVSDKEHVSSYYKPTAFLASPKYTEAAIMCLMAFEQNLLPLLSIVNPKLYLDEKKFKHILTHKKSSSLPESIFRIKEINDKATHINNDPKSNEIKYCDTGQSKQCLTRAWSSVPDIHEETVIMDKILPFTEPLRRKKLNNKSNNKVKLSKSVLKIDYNKIGADSRNSSTISSSFSDNENSSVPEAMDALGYFSKLTPVKITPIETNSIHENNSGNVDNNLIPIAKDETPINYYNINITSCVSTNDVTMQKKKSFIENGGGHSILPMALGFFPKPAKGESLFSFLSSSQYLRSNAELDRENSHFYIAEAVICVMEQVKWDLELQKMYKEERDDISINTLTPDKRKEEEEDNMLMRTDSAGTVFSTQDTLSEVSSSSYLSARSFEEETQWLNPSGNSSASLESLATHASLSRESSSSGLNSNERLNCSGNSNNSSAEAVALSLLKRFSEYKLPAASDIEWLVSEKDAPQEVLPLPNSWPVNPDQIENSTSLRGTYEWAPPRPQILFFPHPTPVRHALMTKQNLRCAGCGMRVALQYATKYRYCVYLGKYFCTGCHSNQTSLIPGKIITGWNFKMYSVSKFSYELLDSMMSDPLFRICDLNPSLFKKVQVLNQVNKLRYQLNSLKDFLLSCRFAEGDVFIDSMRDVLMGQEPHLLMDPDVYSLQDLMDVKSGKMLEKLKHLVTSCASHVNQCELCLARGFICEICKSEEVIFPWQLLTVHRCPKCGACFHSKCFSLRPCMRCIRFKIRRDSIIVHDDENG